MDVKVFSSQAFRDRPVPQHLPCGTAYTLYVELVCSKRVATQVMLNISSSSRDLEVPGSTDEEGALVFVIFLQNGEQLRGWDLKAQGLDLLYPPLLRPGQLTVAYLVAPLNVAIWHVDTRKSAKGVPNEHGLVGRDYKGRLEFLLAAVKAAFAAMQTDPDGCCSVFVAPEYYFVNDAEVTEGVRQHFLGPDEKVDLCEALRTTLAPYSGALIVAGTVGWLDVLGGKLPTVVSIYQKCGTEPVPPLDPICRDQCASEAACRKQRSCLSACEDKGAERLRCESLSRCSKTNNRCEDTFSCKVYFESGQKIPRCQSEDLCVKAAPCASHAGCEQAARGCGDLKACKHNKPCAQDQCEVAIGAAREFVNQAASLRRDTSATWMALAKESDDRKDDSKKDEAPSRPREPKELLAHNTALVWDGQKLLEIGKRYESFDANHLSDDVPGFARHAARCLFNPSNDRPLFNYRNLRIGIEICSDYLHARLPSAARDCDIQLLCSAPIDANRPTAVHDGGYLVQADARSGPTVMAADGTTWEGGAEPLKSSAFPGTISFYRLPVRH